MKIHFTLTCFAYMFMGVGITVQQFGIQAGIGFWPTTTIFSASLIFFVIIIFTSMEKVKEVLYKKDEPTTPKSQQKETPR